MRRAFAILACLYPISVAYAQAPAPAIAPATYRVVYLEVAPAETNRVATALKDYKRAAANAIGALRVDGRSRLDEALDQIQLPREDAPMQGVIAQRVARLRQVGLPA